MGNPDRLLPDRLESGSGDCVAARSIVAGNHLAECSGQSSDHALRWCGRVLVPLLRACYRGRACGKVPLMREPDYSDPNFQAIISEGNFLRQHGRYEQSWERLEEIRFGHRRFGGYGQV